LRALEEANDIAVLGVRGHPVPGSRREGWRAGFDDGMEPPGYSAIRFRHLGDLREHLAFPIRLVRALGAARGRLQLLGTLPHRGSFLVRESLGRLAAGALGRLLRALPVGEFARAFLLRHQRLLSGRLSSPNGPAQQPAHAGTALKLDEPSIAWPVGCSAWFGVLRKQFLKEALGPFE